MLDRIKEEETNIINLTILDILLNFEKKAKILPQNIVKIIQDFESNFSVLSEFDKRADALIELKDSLLKILKDDSNLLNDELVKYGNFCRELCMYSDIYKGFFHIKQIPQVKMRELYLSHLYTASDCFEGFIYKLTQLKELAKYQINEHIKAICLIIFNLLKKILFDSEIFSDDESIHALKVAIRRTCISGLYLAQYLIHDDEDINNLSKTRISTDWSNEEEGSIEQLILDMDEWSKIDYSPSEEEAWDRLRKTLNF